MRKKTYRRVTTPRALGGLVRARRKEQGLTLAKAAGQANQSIRFLSEFERGKVTSEIGKVFDALRTLDLELVVIHRDLDTSPQGTDAVVAKKQAGDCEVMLSLTEPKYRLLQTHAKALGFDNVEQLTLDLYQDIYALESDDPYLAVTKRATRLKEKLDVRLGKTTEEDARLISKHVAKDAKVKF